MSIQSEDLISSANVPAASGGVNGQTTLINLQISGRQIFRVKKMANYANSSAAFSNPGLSWTIYVDGMPLADYINVRDQIGTQSLPAAIPDGMIESKHSLQVICTNNSGTAYIGGFRLQGQYYDEVDQWGGL